MGKVTSKHKDVRFLHPQTLHQLWIETRKQGIGPITVQPLHTGQHLFPCAIKVVSLPSSLLRRIGERILRLELKQCQCSCPAIKNESIHICRQVALHPSQFYPSGTSHKAFVREKLI